MGDPTLDYARTRCVTLAERAGYVLGEETLHWEDGWRGDFEHDTSDLFFSLHKPMGAPFVSMSFRLRLARARTDDVAHLAELISDFEVAFWLERDDRGALWISDRLFVGALFQEAFDFTLANLLAARSAVTEDGAASP